MRVGGVPSVKQELALAKEIDFSKMPMTEAHMTEAMSLFQKMLGNIEDLKQQNPSIQSPECLALNHMFPDLEQLMRDQTQTKYRQQQSPTFMTMLNQVGKDLLGGDNAKGSVAMERLLDEFAQFMRETENDKDMKEVIEGVMKAFVSKDTLYEPMRDLRDMYPQWLEENWDSVSTEQLENHN